MMALVKMIGNFLRKLCQAFGGRPSKEVESSNGLAPNSLGKINCIFCQLEKNPSDEHPIPLNIGGKIIIRNVCKDCNSKLGSEVDSELNRRRHIYDAYMQLDKSSVPNLKFLFIKSYFKDEDGTEIRQSKTNLDRRIVPTQTGLGSFVIDLNDEGFIPGQISKIAKREGLAKEIVEKKIQDYLTFTKNAKPGDRYHDGVLILMWKLTKP